MTIEFFDATKRFPVKRKTIRSWCDIVLDGRVSKDTKLSIKIVDYAEGQYLNQTYLQKNYATNVLCFPSKIKLPDGPMLLGDIAICLPIIEEESIAQSKTLDQHCAHMIVHGILHLLGFDHTNDLEAERMESEEVGILKKLGYSNPYVIQDQMTK